MDQEHDKELQAAKDKLAARFGNATQIGGKGKPDSSPLLCREPRWLIDC